MILKNNKSGKEAQRHKGTKAQRQEGIKMMSSLSLLTLLVAVMFVFNFATCKYSFNDTSPIPQEIKTFRVNYFENKARYVNTQLCPQLTEKLKQKIIGSTRLRQTNDDNAQYDISGYVSDYTVSTSGVTGNTSTTNRLSVTFHLIFKNTVDEKKNFEADVSNSFDFSANKSLSEAESSLNDDMVKNTVDGIFNKIFSNW
jgi:outer membrane lipopolysaccharide assembly protein LptE/RlpB